MNSPETPDFIDKVEKFTFQLEVEDLLALEIETAAAFEAAEKCGCPQCRHRAEYCFHVYEDAHFRLFPPEPTISKKRR